MTRTTKAKDASNKKKKAVSMSNWFVGEPMQLVTCKAVVQLVMALADAN